MNNTCISPEQLQEAIQTAALKVMSIGLVAAGLYVLIWSSLWFYLENKRAADKFKAEWSSRVSRNATATN